jgi:DNA-binding FadR family transcriptional regulator
LAEKLARQILDDIIAGGLEPGDMLPTEATMLQRYPVGRVTLREAIRILEVHGLLTIRAGPGGGPILTAATARDYGRTASLYYRAAGVRLRDLLEARRVMEPVAARLAAEHPTEEGLTRMRETITDLKRLPGNDNVAFLQASRLFHDLVSGMSTNPILNYFNGALIDTFNDRLAQSIVYPPNYREDANRHHIGIGNAILRGNGPLAERLMREHMTEFATYAAQEGWRTGLDEVITWR